MSRFVEEKEIVCVECPLGCVMSAAVDGSEVLSVSGNSCRRGELFARQEAVAPKRNFSMVVFVPGTLEPLSVKTSAPIPRELVLEIAEKVAGCSVDLPVAIGDVVIEGIIPGVDLVATKSLLGG